MANAELQAQRFRFLEALYEKAEGVEGNVIPVHDLASGIGYTNELADKVVTYLVGEGLVKWVTFGNIALTHQGVKEVERAQKTRACRPRTSRRCR
jgi:Mn-dependent DtxR family transcriptional regulator